MARRGATSLVQTNLRLREALRRRLKMEAKKANRSFNAEVVHRLTSSFEVGDVADVLAEFRTELKKVCNGGTQNG